MAQANVEFPDPSLIITFTDAELTAFFGSTTATLMVANVRDKSGTVKDVIIGLKAVPPT